MNWSNDRWKDEGKGKPKKGKLRHERISKEVMDLFKKAERKGGDY